jgi:hypothetical protein
VWVSVAWHLGLLAVLLQAQPEPAVLIEPRPVVVSLAPPLEVIRPPPPEPEPAPPSPPEATPPKPSPPRAEPLRPPPRALARQTPVPEDMPARPAGPPGLSAVASTGPPGPSDADLAGAAVAGSGVGAACDMTRRLQAALRSDPQVQAAVADAHRASGPAPRPLWIWNGGWVRSQGQDGAGLAALREAIQWEVGFAPAACRKDPVRGLVLITLADGPGASRLVLGGGTWRWSDLLGVRRGGG